MKRTTIVLTDEQALLLERERRRRGLPATAIVREALDGYFGDCTEPFSIVGIGRSDHVMTARDDEAILAREWTYERLMGVPEDRAREPADPDAAECMSPLTPPKVSNPHRR